MQSLEEFLATVPIFRGILPEQIREIAPLLLQQTFPPSSPVTAGSRSSLKPNHPRHMPKHFEERPRMTTENVLAENVTTAGHRYCGPGISGLGGCRGQCRPPGARVDDWAKNADRPSTGR